MLHQHNSIETVAAVISRKNSVECTWSKQAAPFVGETFTFIFEEGGVVGLCGVPVERREGGRKVRGTENRTLRMCTTSGSENNSLAMSIASVRVHAHKSELRI